jgi:hypothetical protein
VTGLEEAKPSGKRLKRGGNAGERRDAACTPRTGGGPEGERRADGGRKVGVGRAVDWRDREREAKRGTEVGGFVATLGDEAVLGRADKGGAKGGKSCRVGCRRRTYVEIGDEG